MIPIEAAPIRAELFLQQSYDDTEYYRRFKPNTNPPQPYEVVDCATGLHCHCGYDEQGDVGEPLLATCTGTVYFIDKGWPYGIQSALVPWGTDYAWFYAHQERRTVKDGATVGPGQQIGVMGTSGGVQRHLHLGALQPRTRGCWLNAGPALRAFKAELLNPVQEDDMILFKKKTVSTVYAYVPGNKRALVTEHQLKTIAEVTHKAPVVHDVPDNHEWLSLPMVDQ